MATAKQGYGARLAGLHRRRRWYFHPVIWFIGGMAFFGLFQVTIDAILRWAFL